MRLLVTGGSGLLGSKISEIAIRRSYELYNGCYKHKAMNGISVKFNIYDEKAVKKVFEHIQPKAVIHAAALTDVDKCEQMKSIAWNVNVEGTKNIVNASKQYGAFLIYISTDYIFSGETGMYTETDKPKPVNYYGLTKLKGEEIVSTSSIEWCIVRSSAIYGSTSDVRKKGTAFWVLENLKKRKKIKVLKIQRVSPTLNTNLAEMILEITKRKLSGIYHLAGTTPLSRYEFAQLLAEKLHLDKSLISPAEFHEMKWIARRPKNSSLNVDKALKKFRRKLLKIEDALTRFEEEIRVLK